MGDVSVAIPSFGRHHELGRCLEAVEALAPQPLEILVVLRPDDRDSRLVAARGGERVRVVDVHDPGHLPPLSAALAACRGDVMAVLDDDAVPRASWLERIEQAFSDPCVAGLGGPVADHQHRPERDLGIGPFTAAMRIRLLRGRTVYRGFRGLPTPDLSHAAGLERPLPADLVIGCNMAFRRSVLERIGIDQGLNRGAAINYECDLALGAKRFGKVLFDPCLIVDHYPAPRKGAPSRTIVERYRYDYTYNLFYVAGKHFGAPEEAVFRMYMWLVGQGVSPGLVRRLFSGAQWRRLSLAAHDPLATARAEGLRAGRAAREAGSIGRTAARRGSVS